MLRLLPLSRTRSSLEAALLSRPGTIPVANLARCAARACASTVRAALDCAVKHVGLDAGTPVALQMSHRRPTNSSRCFFATATAIRSPRWSGRPKSFDYLQQLGLPTLGNIYPEIGHEFSPSEVLDMREFLQKNVPPMYKAKVDKPLGATMTEAAFPKGGVQVGGLKEESNAMKAGVQVGDQLLRLNDKPLKTAGFDAVMDEIIAAEGSLELQFVRPIPDREVDWGGPLRGGAGPPRAQLARRDQGLLRRALQPPGGQERDPLGH